jgi:hypothetical protein
MQEIDSVFDQITQTLRSDGFRGVEDARHPEAFGSRYAVFAGLGRYLRLVWDGRESWFLLQEQAPGNPAEWSDIAVERVGSVFAPPDVVRSLLSAWRQMAQDHDA